MVGQTISHYRIVVKLGEGVGVVYLAEDIHLGRRVAIKTAKCKPDEVDSVAQCWNVELRNRTSKAQSVGQTRFEESRLEAYLNEHQPRVPFTSLFPS
jgi:hypothetical protein